MVSREKSSTPHTGAGALAAAGMAALVVLVGGCSGSGGSAAPGSSPSGATSAASAGVSGSTGTAGSAVESASAAAASSPGPVLAQAETSDNGIPLRIALTEVRVHGQLLTVSVAATNLLAAPETKSWQVSGFFSNGIFDATDALSVPEANTADGIYVLDDTNAKRYLVARNQQKLCVCTGDLSRVFATPGRSITVTATFKAPPPEVTTVTVQVPHAKAFTGVPVQR